LRQFERDERLTARKRNRSIGAVVEHADCVQPLGFAESATNF
jgi:hypothetical protein